MSSRQALILGAAALVIGVLLIVAVADPVCDYRDAFGCKVSDPSAYGGFSTGTDARPVLYVVVGLTAVLAVILALTPWARSRAPA